MKKPLKVILDADPVISLASIDKALHCFAGRLVRFADSNSIRPSTFLGVGGAKIFRDSEASFEQ